jgi:hypothetical protein
MDINKKVALKAYQQRVVLEKEELYGKIERLQAFIESDKADILDPMERTDMILQLGIMNQYYGVLCNRIRRF